MKIKNADFNCFSSEHKERLWQSLDKIKEFPAENMILDPDELENVAGGSGAKRVDCWFFPVGKNEYKNGAWRRKCMQYGCWTIYTGVLHECKCFKTEKCIDSWHYDHGSFPGNDCLKK